LEEAISRSGSSLLRLSGSERWALFQDPVEIMRTESLDEVEYVIDAAEKKTKEGLHCCLMVPYDSAPAFDSALRSSRSYEIPAAWAALYKKPERLISFDDFPDSEDVEIRAKNEIAKREYFDSISRIKSLIRDGETYQVNFTFRINAAAPRAAENCFLNLFKFHRPIYGAFVNTGDLKIMSFSPELFLMKKSNILTSFPMKGTAARMPVYEEDLRAAQKLSADSKNRAENLMITDMVRNDLGRISRNGTVKTEALFKTVTTPSVHQMISIVNGTIKGNTGLMDIFRAMFPPASITGAPKVRTMSIIKEIEKSPRGIYTGTIGHISPKGDFIFNVAIRTAVVSGKNLVAGIGGGIVADSMPKSEWDEALLKSSFLKCGGSGFRVFETILFRRNEGWLWLEEHLDRLEKSQKYFLRRFDRKKINSTLLKVSPKFPSVARVKISLSSDGTPDVEFREIVKNGWRAKKINALFSKIRTSSKNIFLYHKTSERKLYDEELKKAQTVGYDEVIFANEKGEITEGAITNIFAKINGGWITPPVGCGLLPGIWRSKMIAKLSAKEQVIGIEEFMSCEKIMIGNSVRDFVFAKIIK